MDKSFSKAIKVWFFTLFLLFSLEAKSVIKKPYLSVCAIFQDEAPYLKEWIEFHRLVGVDHFYLYNHLSTDNYLEVLKPYIDSGTVTLTEWNIPYDEGRGWNTIQCAAYTHAMQMGKNSFWIAVIDTDEFLFPTEKNTLKNFLEEYVIFGAVSVNWQVFGTSDVEKILPGQLMIELLTKKAPFSYGPNCHVKCIVRPKAVTKWVNPHFPELKPNFLQCNTGKEIIKGPFNSNNTLKARINHYWTRDEDFFYNHKIPRSTLWRSLEQMLEMKNELNIEEDTDICRFVPELKKRIFSE